jgi:hypothetical protein
LTYTLKGSTTFINLTKALDVRVQLEEKVSNTNTKRFVLHRINYQTEQIEGNVILLNHKSEEVTVVINLLIQGKMSNYSIAPKKDSIQVNGDVTNQQHDIRWEIRIKPKEKMEIKYIRLYNQRV